MTHKVKTGLSKHLCSVNLFCVGCCGDKVHILRTVKHKVVLETSDMTLKEDKDQDHVSLTEARVG